MKGGRIVDNNYSLFFILLGEQTHEDTYERNMFIASLFASDQIRR